MVENRAAWLTYEMFCFAGEHSTAQHTLQVSIHAQGCGLKLASQQGQADWFGGRQEWLIVGL